MVWRRRVSIGLASCGVLVAAVAMGGVAWSLSSAAHRQPLWPLPVLYLIEVVVLACVVLAAVVLRSDRTLRVAWAAIGALSTLTVLGAMTIGPFVGVSSLLLIAAASMVKPRTSGRAATQLLAFAAGLTSQVVGMVAAIQAMLP